MIAETIYCFEEALLALQTIREAGLEAVATPVFIRSLAEAVDKTTPVSGYSVDMSRHFFFGTQGHFQ